MAMQYQLWDSVHVAEHHTKEVLEPRSANEVADQTSSETLMSTQLWDADVSVFAALTKGPPRTTQIIDVNKA